MERCELESGVGRGSVVGSPGGAGACVGSGTMLLLLPKCPACLAAYLSLWTGLGVANSVAGHLRFAVGGIFLASLVWLLLQRVFTRRPRARREGEGDEESF
jgi:hypothetical protein